METYSVNFRFNASRRHIKLAEKLSLEEATEVAVRFALLNCRDHIIGMRGDLIFGTTKDEPEVGMIIALVKETE